MRLHGSVMGSGSTIYAIRCESCGKKNSFTGQQLRAATAEAKRFERARVARQRAEAADEKEAKRIHAEERQGEVDDLNGELQALVNGLETLLSHTLGVDDYLDFESLKEVPSVPEFDPGELAVPEETPRRVEFLPVAPSGVGRLVPGAGRKHEAAVAAGEARFAEAWTAYQDREATRRAALADAQARYEEDVLGLQASVEEQHKRVESLKQRFERAEPAAIVEYFGTVLDRSEYPESVRHSNRLAYVAASKQLAVEFELPTLDVVPAQREFRYIKTKDEVKITARPATERRSLYASVVAQIALRTVHEVLEADRTEVIDTVVFNGHVTTLDKRTGQTVHPCLVTLRTSRDVFSALNLAGVDPAECLKGLNASLSRNPAELAPVRPLLDFDMADPRFIEESDVLGELDQRANLMDLSPSEFESLITNLFAKMGLETRLTQASRDGGVDCVAYDQRPILGGKVVIQAKRYKNTVGVSAVRDLFGTMQNEGASKGILVTTSGYGKASFDFAGGKPLELIDGGNLLYLLKEHAGMDARIVPPDDWIDPPEAS
jgi:restriction system protein